MGQPAAAPVPYCIIGKVSYGLAQALKVPEARAHLYTGPPHGWTVLIRDSEFPVPAYVEPVPTQSNPRRCDDEDDAA